ncbi:MAG TPA: cupin domain-containing protein [Candidatus Eisenbacteria bacterium]|nr:cupin domain-containing protein [Candidatus Eisenbacteria bacterium]
MQKTKRDKPDDVAPDGSEIRFILDTKHGATRAGLCEVRLGPGAISKPVRHRTVEEIWYFTRGEGWVWRCPPETESSPSQTVHVGPGDALLIPAGWSFQFKASETGELRFLCYTCPPWPYAGEAVAVERGGFD